MLLEHLSARLLLTPEYIETVARTASRRYATFEIAKKSGDGTRTVSQPSRELKAIQRVVHDDFLARLPSHPSACAYVKGSTLINHASRHSQGLYLLRLDFRNFFESISKSDVRAFIRSEMPKIEDSWTDSDTSLFSDLVCYKDRLTIGSNTSPLLSNAICYELDSKISLLSVSKELIYTRYSDDLYFSCRKKEVLKDIPNEVRKIIRDLEAPTSLWLNLKKTMHSSHKRRMSVTGLTIANDGKVSIGREKKREIKSLIYEWENLGEKEKKYLAGYLAYCKSVDPHFINQLCVKYGAGVVTSILRFQAGPDGKGALLAIR